MMLLTLRGTALIYYGDEIGMSDVPVPPEAAADPDGRDGARTPMQWAPGPAAGFTTGRPWLPVAEDADLVNVATQRARGDSLLWLYRRLIALRRAQPALSIGSYTPVPSQRQMLAYQREQDGRRVLVALNFGHAPAPVELPSTVDGRLLLSTDPDRAEGPLGGQVTLSAAEGVVIELPAADSPACAVTAH